MKSSLILAFYMLCTLSLQAQIDFTKIVNTSNSNYQNVMMLDISHSSNATFKMTGIVYNNGLNGYDYFLSEFDTLGNSNIIGTYNFGYWYATAKAMLTKDGGSIHYINGISGSDPCNIFFKLNATGQVEWVKMLKDTLNSKFTIAATQILGNDTLYHFWGGTLGIPVPLGQEPMLLTLDSRGNFLSEKSFGDNDIFTESPLFVEPTKDGGFLLFSNIHLYSSQTVRQYTLVKFNSLMQIQWSKRYAPDPACICTGAKILELQNNSFMIAVNLFNQNTNIGQNMFIRLDSLGQSTSVHSYNQEMSCQSMIAKNDSTIFIEAIGPNYNQNNLITIDTNGNVLSAKRISLNTTGLNFEKTLRTNLDSAIVNYGPIEISFLTKEGLSTCGDSILSIPPDTSILYQQVAYPPVINNYTYVLSDTAFAAVGSPMSLQFTEACNSITGIENSVKDFEINLFPNPAAEILILQSTNDLSNYKYTIINSEGRNCANGKVLSSDTTIKINNYPAGLYFLELNNGNSILKKRFLVVK